MINLSAIFSAPVGVVTNQISYARIDNTTTPVFVQAGNFITSPAVVATNIPAGQYQVDIIPIYADGRTCAATTYQTPACPGLYSISGYISAGNLVVTYNAPSTAPKVRITVGYPNGGTNVANYVNAGNPIVIAIPSGLTGDFTIQGQSVCDESSGFYSALSSTVVVTIASPVAGVFSLGTTSAAACGATPGTYYTNGPFGNGAILYSDVTLLVPVTGFNFVVYNSTVYSIDPGSATIGAATGSNCTGTATLTFHFVHNTGGTFLQFEATLSRAIDGNVTISKIFADGFSDGSCSTDVASAQKNTPMTILAGSLGVGQPPDALPPPSGTWNTAIKDSIYNVIVNGSPVINGSTLTIGSYTVTMIIPACE